MENGGEEEQRAETQSKEKKQVVKATTFAKQDYSQKLRAGKSWICTEYDSDMHQSYYYMTVIITSLKCF